MVKVDVRLEGTRHRPVGHGHDFLDDICASLSRTPIDRGFLYHLLAAVFGCQDDCEGRSFPTVFLTNDIGDAARALNARHFYQIGESTANVQGTQQMLDLCRPLASGNWAVFCELRANSMAFGMLAMGEGRAAAFGAEIALGHDVDIVRISRFSEGPAEVTSSGDISMKFDVQVRPALARQDAVRVFTRTITRTVQAADRPLAKLFFDSVLRMVDKAQEGCLIAIVDSRQAGVPACHDAVMLPTPIDLPRVVSQFRGSPSATEDHAALLASMVTSDGISVFDSAGRLRAYRWFVQLPESREGVLGGARHRAFQSLCMMVDRGDLLGAYLKSREGGWTFRENARLRIST